MTDFGNKGQVRVLLQQAYHHDATFDRCACGRRKLHSDRGCGFVP